MSMVALKESIHSLNPASDQLARWRCLATPFLGYAAVRGYVRRSHDRARCHLCTGSLSSRRYGSAHNVPPDDCCGQHEDTRTTLPRDVLGTVSEVPALAWVASSGGAAFSNGGRYRHSSRSVRRAIWPDKPRLARRRQRRFRQCLRKSWRRDPLDGRGRGQGLKKMHRFSERSYPAGDDRIPS